MLSAIIKIAAIIPIATAIWAPEAGEDWTLLKPAETAAQGSFLSLPYDFGIVVKAYDTHANYYALNLNRETKTLEVGQDEGGQVRKVTTNLENDSMQIENEASGEVPLEQNVRSRKHFRRDDETPFAGAARYVACALDTTLLVTLENGILRDIQGRVGLIVASKQFQFDGPPPQHGAIYSAGWSVTSAGYLQLGSETKFWQCQLGEHYNLYNEEIAYQCSPVVLEVVELTTC